MAALIGMLVWFGWAARKKPSWQEAGVAGRLLLVPLAASLLPRIGDVLLAAVLPVVELSRQSLLADGSCFPGAELNHTSWEFRVVMRQG